MAEPKEPQVFAMPDAKSKLWLWILSGAGLCIAGIAGMVLAITWRVDQIQLHLMATLPLTMSAFSFLNAWTVYRSPRCLVVDEQGIGLQNRNGVSWHPWKEVGWSTVQGNPHLGKVSRYYDIFDISGKRIVRVSDTIDQFDFLVETVKAGICAQANPVTSQVQLKRAHRNAWIALATALFLGAACSFIVWDGWNKARADRLLVEKGQVGQAEILRRFLAPDGRTPRLEYRITNAQGVSAEHNAEMHRFVWDMLEGQKNVQVLYVSEEPSISRLAMGEVVEDDTFMKPPGCYILGGIGGFMSLIVLGIAILFWFGWDLDMDSKTGKFSIKRFGEGE